MTVPARRDAAIRRGSQSFAIAARLFDPPTRALVWDLYTWCRHCDDTIDGQHFGHAGRAADAAAGLTTITAATERALAGAPDPDDEAASALARVVAATGLPPAWPRAHLAGFAMDAAGRRYETLDDTLDYCFHVAGVVGLMMAWVLGARTPPALARGCDLGLAFQLTNIARDVGEDLRHGRVYVPAEFARAAGAALVPGRGLDDDTAARLVPAVTTLLGEAERYYASAWEGLGALPARSAWAVATARRVYRDIGWVVQRRGPRAWQARAATSTPRKALRLMQALGDVAGSRGRDPGRAPRVGLWTPPLAHLAG